MRRSLPPALLVAGILLTACATADRTPGSGWREVTSAHFQVVTDLDEGEAKAAALDLERYRSALLAHWKHPELESPRTRMVLYSDPSDFRSHGARNFAGFYRDLRGERLLVEARSNLTQEGLGLAKTSAHELAHEINAAFLMREPRWVSEGLASYLSTVTVEDGVARFGRAPLEYLERVQYYKPLGLEDLFGWDALDPSSMPIEQLDRYYVWSWAWISYLDHERGDRMDDFLARLARAEDPRQAFTAAFGAMDDSKTEMAIRSMCQRIISFTRVPMPPVAETVSVRPLTPAGFHVVEAQVWSDAPGTDSEAASKQFARQELAQALASEPKNQEALTLLAQVGSDSERVQSARTLTQLAPDNGRAWVLLTEALGPGLENEDERGRAFGQALKHVGDDPFVMISVARHILQGDPKLALDLSTRAAQLAPYDWENVRALAFAEVVNGRCDRAKADGARALDLLPESAPKSAKDRISANLNEMLARCNPANAGT